jgi:hypothetical protein
MGDYHFFGMRWWSWCTRGQYVPIPFTCDNGQWPAKRRRLAKKIGERR